MLDCRWDGLGESTESDRNATGHCWWWRTSQSCPLGLWTTLWSRWTLHINSHSYKGAPSTFHWEEAKLKGRKSRPRAENRDRGPRAGCGSWGGAASPTNLGSVGTLWARSDRPNVFHHFQHSCCRIATPDAIILSIVDCRVAIGWGQDPRAPPPCVCLCMLQVNKVVKVWHFLSYTLFLVLGYFLIFVFVFFLCFYVHIVCLQYILYLCFSCAQLYFMCCLMT